MSESTVATNQILKLIKDRVGMCHGYSPHPIPVPCKLFGHYNQAKLLFDMGWSLFIVPKNTPLEPRDLDDEAYVKYSYNFMNWHRHILESKKQVAMWRRARVWQVIGRILLHARTQPRIWLAGAGKVKITEEEILHAVEEEALDVERHLMRISNHMDFYIFEFPHIENIEIPCKVNRNERFQIRHIKIKRKKIDLWYLAQILHKKKS